MPEEQKDNYTSGLSLRVILKGTERQMKSDMNNDHYIHKL